jgi:hypothetical protein
MSIANGFGDCSRVQFKTAGAKRRFFAMGFFVITRLEIFEYNVFTS